MPRNGKIWVAETLFSELTITFTENICHYVDVALLEALRSDEKHMQGNSQWHQKPIFTESNILLLAFISASHKNTTSSWF